MVAAELRRRSAPAGEEPPYPGLASFGPGDAGRFFGREDVVELLLSRLEDERFLVVEGPSGSGKTSVLRSVAERSGRPAVFLRPGRQPLAECAAWLAPLTGTPAARLRAEFAADPGLLHPRIRQALPAETEILLVVDQFEDVFTGADDGFLTALPAAAKAPVRVVLGLRTGFADACARHPALAEAMRDALVSLGPLTAGQVRAALVRPAANAGRTPEVALVATLMAEVARQPGALPFATEALRRTWRTGALTSAGYDATGGITAVVADTAEAVYSRLAPPEQAVARELFLRLVTFGDGTADTRRLLHRDELDTTTVVERFVQARLITTDRAGLELAHDALIDGWPRLRAWLAEDRDALRVHRRLTEATRLWETAEREPAALYRGARLDEALTWARRADARPNTRERRFLLAGVRQRDVEETASRRSAVRRRRLSATAMVSTVLAAASTVAAVLQHRRAGRSRIFAGTRC